MLADFLSQHSASKRKLATIILASVIGWSAGSQSVGAETRLKPEPGKWKLNEPFGKSEDARMNLSGAACVPTTPKFKSCLIANDEKKYAQFFSINGTTLNPRKLTLVSDEKKNPDAEGVAYADGFFYVTGSHGRGRHGDSDNDSSYAIFRIPVDSMTGLPKFKPNEGCRR
jgi:hypothetical protein